jgi:hypothetical protein
MHSWKALALGLLHPFAKIPGIFGETSGNEGVHDLYCEKF